MDINIRMVEDVAVVDLDGELDANTSATAQEQVLPLANQAGKILLDLSGVTYMSSAGLRMLLYTYREISASGGRIGLVGLSEELRDTMTMTGFLSFFDTHETIDSGLQAINA